MRTNRARTTLREGHPAFGCLVRYPDASLVEFLALQGFDFLVFDGEHGTLGPQACEHMVRAAELHGVAPGVRVEENRPAAILRYLDTGVLGCHVPSIDSRDAAERAVRAIKFRPLGDRGLSASRASGFGAADGYPAYIAEANRQVQLIAHIESRAGVAAAEEIAAVEGVDVLFVGPLDLSHDLGCPGEVQHPEVVSRAERVAAAAATHDKVLGVIASDRRAAEAWIQRGARYVVTTVESLIAPGVGAFLSEAPA